MPQDYYQTLGINKSSTDDEIKKAYRKIAREHHPDMVGDKDKTQAEKRFKEINEAYQVLSDSQKRKMYDQFGHQGSGFNQGGGQGQGGNRGPFTYSYSSGGQNSSNFDFGDVNPFDIFEDFFGFRGFGGRNQKPQKGKNLYYEFEVEFKDAIFGAEKEVNIESGKTKIKIPKGVRDGTELRFSEKGMPGPNNLPPGDLFITTRVKTPKEFKRGGDDLAVILELDFLSFVLGDTISVPVIDLKEEKGIGQAKLKIPEGTANGSQFMLRGKGMPKLNGSGQGNIIVQVLIKIPKKLSRKQKTLLEEYRNIE